MILDYEQKKIHVKIVFYGPAMSGKTTSIKYLFSYFGKDDLLESIDNSVGRTLFFDFGVLEFKGKEWEIKFLIYSSTGQDFYASTRPATLKGVDGIIFVIDSQHNRLNQNLRSWNELISLFGHAVFQIPIIFSLNKYDLIDIKKLEEKDFLPYIELEKFKNCNFIKTEAVTGTGVIEGFEKIINSIFPNLLLNLNSIEA